MTARSDTVEDRSRQLQPGELVIVDESRLCSCCGRHLMAGIEGRRVAEGAVVHTACAESLGGPAGR